MQRQMLRAKIHRIAVTERDVEYEGSLTLDSDLMRAAELLPFEKIDVYDITNASRFSTYVIEGPAGSGACCVNGAAARLVETGDKLRKHRPGILEQRPAQIALLDAQPVGNSRQIPYRLNRCFCDTGLACLQQNITVRLNPAGRQRLSHFRQ